MQITRRGNQTRLSISNPIKISTKGWTGKDEAALVHAQNDSCGVGCATVYPAGTMPINSNKRPVLAALAWLPADPHGSEYSALIKRFFDLRGKHIT